MNYDVVIRTDTQEVLLVQMFSESVWAGRVASLEDIEPPRPPVPTRIEELKVCFLFPSWRRDRWFGLQPRKVTGRQMGRLRGDDGSFEHFSNDETVYVQAAPRAKQRPTFSKKSHPDDKLLRVMPWRRAEPKNVKGRGRRRRREKGMYGQPTPTTDWLGEAA